MDKIKAKSVVHNKFWILQNKQNKKVGQVKAADQGFEVRLNGSEAGCFKTLASFKESPLFEFTDLPALNNDPSNSCHGYKTNTIAHNAVWNMQYKLPLFTQTEESKSWFAAGYYKLNISGTWIVQYCPKLITLQRHEYKGPMKEDPGLNNFNRMFS